MTGRQWARLCSCVVAVVLLLAATGCAIMELPVYAREATQLFGDEQTTFHVAPWGDDGNPGTRSLPHRTIQYALSRVPLVNDDRVELRVAAGDYTPGSGLVSGGTHGLSIEYRYHQPDSDRDLPVLVLSFGWNRLFSELDPARGGGTTRLIGNSDYEGGSSAVVLAVYGEDGSRLSSLDNLELSWATNGSGDGVTLFAFGVLGDLQATARGSLAVFPGSAP